MSAIPNIELLAERCLQDKTDKIAEILRDSINCPEPETLASLLVADFNHSHLNLEFRDTMCIMIAETLDFNCKEYLIKQNFGKIYNIVERIMWVFENSADNVSMVTVSPQDMKDQLKGAMHEVVESTIKEIKSLIGDVFTITANKNNTIPPAIASKMPVPTSYADARKIEPFPAEVALLRCSREISAAHPTLDYTMKYAIDSLENMQNTLDRRSEILGIIESKAKHYRNECNTHKCTISETLKVAKLNNSERISITDYFDHMMNV